MCPLIDCLKGTTDGNVRGGEFAGQAFADSLEESRAEIARPFADDRVVASDNVAHVLGIPGDDDRIDSAEE